MQNEQNIIELATSRLLKMKWGSPDVLTVTHKYWHQDVKNIWRDLTTAEKSWYILFILAIYYSDWEALEMISPSLATYNQIRKWAISKTNSRGRDIVSISLRRWEAMLKNPQKRAYNPNFTIRDIPVDITTQFKTAVHSAGFAPALPEYDKPHSSPVKKIDPVQHLATRKPDQRLGVRLEYDFPKVSPQKADKVVESWLDALDMEQE